MRARKLHLLVIGFVVAATLPVLASGAEAVVGCMGDVSGSVTLTDDVSCPTGNGMRINADNTVIHLNGHYIDGADTGQFGIFNDFGFVKVKILGPGTISNFQAGISMAQAHKSKIMGDITLDSNGEGIFVGGDKVQIKGVTISNNAFDALVVSGDKALVQGTTITNNASGIRVIGDNAKVIGNEVSLSGGDGIKTEGLKASVKKNTSNDNVGDGIEVDDITAKVLSNTANDNDLFGILGPVGIKAKKNLCAGNNGAGPESDPASACNT